MTNKQFARIHLLQQPLLQAKLIQVLIIQQILKHKTQSQKFTFKQKEEYDRMLSVADEKVFVSEESSKSCMQKRNQFMVDRASVVVAYIKRDFGGTANTVKYATKNQVPIIEIN